MNSDYYSTIYAWFEKCGIISDVRTHLRHNLVNALKSTDMTLNKDNSGPKSAKQYIYDLLIAEYLWNHNYAYTLSVFASEAPLLVNIRKHVKPGSEDDKQKLQNDYVTHALETLGIRPDEPDGQSIIADYDNNDMPLLLTILKFIYTGKLSYTYSARTEVKNCQTQTDFKISEDILREKRKIINARKKLQNEQDSYKIFETNLKKLQEELAKVQQELSSKNEEKVTQIRTHEVSTQTEVIDSEKIIINNCDDEKRQLQSLAQEQQLRIEELTLRAIRLSRQLEEVQLLKPVIEVTRPVFSKTLTTVLSESSSTDDIIQDAKQRLKRLEEESFKADQSYFNCITGLPL
ncbi:hypothetical protein G9C98_006930 [Cotesia typhae]|uniref:LisH domain-containing protein n=1 Tax=Cotesia typhae TaxID=2053667 RepID=A0A8J5RAC9_9HYME|nr:hypothetical protein G9C98_006930 [Cotesia typhae]